MYTLRCAVTLERSLRHIPGEAESGPQLPTTRLGDWAVYRKHLGPRPALIAVSHVTLLPVLLWAAPIDTVGQRLKASVGLTLMALGVPAPALRTELAEMDLPLRGRIQDRRVRGTLNEFAFRARVHAAHAPEPLDLLAIGLRLSETPCGARAYASPAALTVALFGETVTSAGNR